MAGSSAPSWAEITPEISSSNLRPKLVSFIKNELTLAKGLPQAKLLGPAGSEIAATLFSAILHQYAEFSGDGWLTSESEPLIDRIFKILLPIDESPENNSQKIWDEIFALADRL